MKIKNNLIPSGRLCESVDGYDASNRKVLKTRCPYLHINPEKPIGSNAYCDLSDMRLDGLEKVCGRKIEEGGFNILNPMSEELK